MYFVVSFFVCLQAMHIVNCKYFVMYHVRNILFDLLCKFYFFSHSISLSFNSIAFFFFFFSLRSLHLICLCVVHLWFLFISIQYTSNVSNRSMYQEACSKKLVFEHIDCYFVFKFSTTLHNQGNAFVGNWKTRVFKFYANYSGFIVLSCRIMCIVDWIYFKETFGNVPEYCFQGSVPPDLLWCVLHVRYYTFFSLVVCTCWIEICVCLLYRAVDVWPLWNLNTF